MRAVKTHIGTCEVQLNFPETTSQGTLERLAALLEELALEQLQQKGGGKE